MLKNCLEKFQNTLTYKFGIVTGNCIGILFITLLSINIMYAVFLVRISGFSLFDTIGGTLWLLSVLLFIFGTIPSVIFSFITIILLIVDLIFYVCSPINKRIIQKSADFGNSHKVIKFCEVFGITFYFISVIWGVIYSVGYIIVNNII